MNHDFFSEHASLSRRYFLQLGVASAALPLVLRAADGAEVADKALAAAIAKLEYFTKQDAFGTVERGNPLPYKHPEEKLREAGMTRETWKLEIISDPAAPAKIETPRSKETNNPVDFAELMKLAEKHAVRIMKVITCNNGNKPLGMGLWEGVPLRELVWLTKPSADVRRVFFYGYHNDDPKQRFQGSLPVGRVLEDPPGEYPIIVAYKLNGEFISGKRGGPVRMIAPETYGFKNVKWLNTVVLTNAPYGNDTYANGNNDVDSWLKTMARFISFPDKVKAGAGVPITGVAQVGMGGLRKVQYFVCPHDTKPADDDPDFTKATWQDAEILSPSAKWGGDLPDGKLPAGVANFDEQGKPKQWPLRYAIAHWAALVKDLAPGKYDLRCRTIDANGMAQPQPRPFPKSGRVSIQQVEFTVES